MIADSEQNNFENTIHKYTSNIGTNTNVTNSEGYQTATKSIDGVDENGEYHQAIIIKGMIWIPILYHLLRLMDKLPPEADVIPESNKYLCLTTVLHELGHAIDNKSRYNREGYCKDQVLYDLSKEYEEYVNQSVLSLWGGYFAESFC